MPDRRWLPGRGLSLVSAPPERPEPRRRR
jgi:hypothetical protein